MRTTNVLRSLTAAESSFKEHIQAMQFETKEDNTENIYHAIVTAKGDFLLELAMIDPDIDKICKHAKFDSHWKNAWRQMGLNPSEFHAINKDPLHENLPIVTVSCLDLLKGDYIYQKYQSLVESQEITPKIYQQAKSYLEKAAGYGSYFALNALCTNGLKQLKSIFVSTERKLLAEQILAYAQKAANLHFTPGYLLLSNVLQELHLYDLDMYPDVMDESALKKSFFMNAAVALCTAQKLENVSSGMINNAYQGKTLWQACSGVFSTWLQAKIRLQGMSCSLTLQDMTAAARIANLTIRNLDKKYNLDKLESALISDVNAVSYKTNYQK